MNSGNQQQLVNVIRGVHEKLRKSLLLIGDCDKVWTDHIAEEDLRRKYASAMVKLATEIWNEKESRIHWSYETCVDYFINNGIERSILRELKIQHKWCPSQVEKLKSLCHSAHEENNYKNLSRKLKLLDVGSCYNPFSKFPIFSCVAIDLTPATEDVMQCDFLRLKIRNQSSDEACSHIESMLVAESFDVVVFSLVLEYLPGKEQRLEFCSKAWKLLQKNGLLIIITPDSKSLQHNAPMIKNWKTALEKIGFNRIKYDKLTHLHCMAFRKVSKSLDIDVCFKSLSELMYIPQDFKAYDTLKNSSERTEDENSFVLQQFSELPNELLF